MTSKLDDLQSDNSEVAHQKFHNSYLNVTLALQEAFPTHENLISLVHQSVKSLLIFIDKALDLNSHPKMNSKKLPYLPSITNNSKSTAMLSKTQKLSPRNELETLLDELMTRKPPQKTDSQMQKNETFDARKALTMETIAKVQHA